MIEYRKYKSGDYKSYAKFCSYNFGRKKHQFNSWYINWLYGESDKSFLVAVSKGEIVGIIHNFKAPVCINGKTRIVTVLHDLMVDKKYRNGAGFFLIKEGLYSDEFVVLPGSVGRLSRAYGRLGSKPFKSFWYKKYQIPRKIFTTNKLKDITVYQRLARKQGLLFGHNKEKRNDFIKIALKKFNHNYYYMEYLKWRFMDENSPLTFFVADEAKKNSVLFIIGKRGLISYARVFYVNVDSEAAKTNLLKFIDNYSLDMGIPIILYTSFESPPSDKLRYKEYSEAPVSYVFSRNKKLEFSTVVPSFCSDLGFDGID